MDQKLQRQSKYISTFLRIWNRTSNDKTSKHILRISFTMAMTGAKRLRELMSKEDHIVVAPGVYDGLSGRIALAAGAEVLYMVRSLIDHLIPPTPTSLP